jgi:kinetochore protein Nuf2
VLCTSLIPLSTFEYELLTASASICSKKLMVSVGVNDFQMSDLNKPESKRMVRYLSAIINFLKFRGERRAKFDEYDTEFVRRILSLRPCRGRWRLICSPRTRPIQDALEEQKNELESKNQECKEELDKLKRRLQAEQPMVRDITMLESL